MTDWKVGQKVLMRSNVTEWIAKVVSVHANCVDAQYKNTIMRCVDGKVQSKYGGEYEMRIERVADEDDIARCAHLERAKHIFFMTNVPLERFVRLEKEQLDALAELLWISDEGTN